MILRNEYPRPDFVRNNWVSLNGMWDYRFDDQNIGLHKDWIYDWKSFTKKIIVPFPYQSSLSGIEDKAIHPIIWYHRSFSVPSEWLGKRVLLNFGASDYESTVWVNGRLAGFNRGGYVPFTFDITELVELEQNEIVVRVLDSDSIIQPRGKQNAKEEPWGCWYTPVSGIWQSVWLEPVSDIYLQQIKLIPDINRSKLEVRYQISQFVTNLNIRFIASFQDEVVNDVTVPITKIHSRYTNKSLTNGFTRLSLSDLRLWSPEEPQLYDLQIELSHAGKIIDTVKSYFGMRQISVENGRVCLNYKPYYLRMVLDQGYWSDGIYTPESIEQFALDIKLAKSMGFNGVRKHQKIEDPYFYYFCDRLGLLVWEEMPSCYQMNETAIRYLMDEWQRVIQRDFNHPSIIAWVPMNESWGVDPLVAQDDPVCYKAAIRYLETLYYLTKTLDETRLVICNDGWQQVITDIVTIHEYTQNKNDLQKRYKSFKQNRHGLCFTHNLPILLQGSEYKNQPIMLTEFGGVKVEEQQVDGWGYGNSTQTYEEMLERIEQLMEVITSETEICGFCYTQLTDVDQEINGLLDHSHHPKVEVERLARIFGG